MPARPAVHPSADVLKAFGLGKLDDTSADVLMNHLDQCDDCCQVVASQSGDDFLDRLRQGHGRYSTVPPANAVSESVADPRPPQKQAPSSQTAIPNLPPELADNPQYEILRELGRGGMGVVYLARNKQMDRLEVLKVINKTLLDRPGSAERFLREIRSAAKLSHANVVAAYSVPQLGDLLAFAMEYVEGQDLAAVVKAHGPLSVPHACYYIQQAALGLQHAFEKNMVHRDIKPQNLILAREGKKHLVKILDFGLAKVMREKTEDSGLTGEGQMLGTPDYIAPEQTLDAAKADIRADIYSLGCTLYYLLAGRPPFSAASLGAILLAHQMQEAKLLNLVRPEVPQELASVVRKMMDKTPAKRYQTPLEVAQALAVFIKPGAKGGTAPKSSPELSVGTPRAAGVKVAKADGPAVPTAEGEQRKAVVTQVSSPVAWDSVTESVIASPEPRKSGALRKRRPPAARKKWWIGGGVAVGVLLVALLGMWAGGVFKVKTKNGTIVLENLPADAEVVVDGDTVTVTSSDGEAFSISVAAGKKHQLQVKKKGFKVFGQEVEIDSGKRQPIRVSMEPESATGESVAENKGFVPLFNGKDLTGWYVESGNPAQWTVEGNAIVGKSPAAEQRNYLLTNHDYADFTIRLQFMLEPDSFGAIALRATAGEDLGADNLPDHPLIGLLDPVKFKSPAPATGVAYWIQNGDKQSRRTDPTSPLQLTTRTWHSLEITMQADHCITIINGIKLQDLHRGTRGSSKVIPALERSHGKIGFKSQIGAIRFRKIEIKELAPNGPAPAGNAGRLEESLKLDREARIGSGSWKVKEGELVHTDPVGGNCCIQFGDPSWTDYDYSFEAVKTNGAFGIAALFRARDLRNFMVFDLAGWQNRKYAVECFVNGQHNWITHARPGAMAKNRKYRVLVKVRDNHFRCYLNDLLIYEFRDSRQVRGAVGFRCWGGAVRVHSIKVSDPDGKILWEGPPKLNTAVK